MANRITTIFDLDSKGFDSGIKSLRKEVASADGAIEKMKVAGSGLGTLLQENIASAAMAAGAALVTFGVKSVQAFQDTAIAAGKFSDAAGIAVDDASRWIEVSGDLGVSADAVQGAMQKMNKAIADGKPVMDEFGDAIVRSADGTVNSSASFQNLVTQIGAIKDPTERAKAAQEAFGKSYGEIAELMSMSATDLKSALDGVSEAKVIDAAELEKAHKFRAAMDDLRDRLENVALAVGEQIVPVLGEMADAVGVVDDALASLSGNQEGGGIAGLVRAAYESSNLSKFVDFVNGMGEVFGDSADEADNLTTAIEYGTTAADEMARVYGERLPDSADGTTLAFDAAAEAANNLAIKTGQVQRAAEQLDGAWSRLKGEIDDDQAWIDLQGTFDDLRSKGEAAMTAAKDGADDAESKMRDFQTATNDAKDRIIDLGKQIGLTPTEVETLLTMTDEGSIDEVERRLEILTRNRTINLDIIDNGGAGYGDRFGGYRASGGPVQAGKAYIVGEKGPEIVVPDASGTVVPNDQITRLSSSAGITRTVSTRGGGGGGGGTSEDRLMSAMAETGDISQQEYRDYLSSRLGEFEKYSDDYMRIWRQISSIDRNQQREQETAAREAQRLADEQARQAAADEAAKQKAADDEIRRTDQIMAAMYEMGQLSLQDYQSYLTGRLGAYEQYSQQYMAIWRQLQTLEGGGGRGGGNAASADEVRLAELEAQRLQFISDMYGLDPKRTEEEKLKARIDAANAAERLAKLRSSMTSTTTTSAPSTNVTINMPPGADGASVVRAIQQYERRNGTSWRA